MLNNIRVLEFGSMISAPFATYLLSDLGAEVIKVEPLNGDPLRYMSNRTKDNSSAFFESVNRGKSSISIDFNNEHDVSKLSMLISTVDIVVHNYLPKTAKILKIDYEHIFELNPTVIYISVNGFGSNTPNGNKPGLDMVFQGLSGMMSMTGEGDTPIRTPSPIIDLSTGLYCALAATAALNKRTSSNQGSNIDISMLNTAIAMQSPLFHQFFSNNSANLEKKGNRSHGSFTNCYSSKDGYVNISITKLSQWNRLQNILEVIPIDVKSYSELFEYESTIFNAIAKYAAGMKTDRLISELENIGIPSGAVLEYDEVMKSTYVRDTRCIYKTSDGDMHINQPYYYSGKSTKNTYTPLIGEHNEKYIP